MFHTFSLALRNLRARLPRTILTAGAVILGVAVILATNIAIRSTEAAIINMFDEASGKAHLTVLSATNSNRGFSEQILRKVAKTQGIESAVPILQVHTQPAETEVAQDAFLYGDDGLLLYGVDPLLDPLAREYTIVEDRFLDPDREGYEIVLVEDIAREHDIQVGR